MLDAYLQRLVGVGDLTVEVEGARPRRFGDGGGPPIVVRLTRGAAASIAMNPELKLGECFMEGELTFLQGDMYRLLELVARNPGFYARSQGPLARLRREVARRLVAINDRRTARRNVAHHYDLSYELYRRFLDADMQYSCAYFARPGLSLEEAQQAKKMHIAAKLRLPQEGRLLDIGCGWGGMGLTLAHAAPGLEITGVTLSEEQLTVARRRAQQEGVSDRVRFELQDYRDVAGAFDRIVSVGMFEHVGLAHYPAFFERVAELLTDDGVALLHAIGRRTPPIATQPFIAKYIFPGGYIPSLSDVLPAIERAGLWVADIEILRLHYAETLREWRRRFEASRAEIAAIYDERFCRMWEFYLVSSEAGFRWFGMMIFQIQLIKQVSAVPLTRDYMVEEEVRLAQAGGMAEQAFARAG